MDMQTHVRLAIPVAVEFAPTHKRIHSTVDCVIVCAACLLAIARMLYVLHKKFLRNRVYSIINESHACHVYVQFDRR